MLLTTITLRIFFFGLIAFTPDEFQCGKTMRALLLEAKAPPASSDGCHSHPHEPLIYFQSSSCSADCPDVRGLCRCEISSRYLLDLPDSVDEKLCWQGPQMPTSTPPATCEEDDFKYIPKMKGLRPPMRRGKMDLKDSCDKPCPVGKPYICQLVEGQVNFKPHSVKTCIMSGEEEGKAPKLKLRPLSSANMWNGESQLTAELMQFTHEVTTTETNPTSLDITLVKFERDGTKSMKLPVFKEGEKYYAEMIIANSMDMDRADGRCGQDLIARDFELYHDLAKDPYFRSDRHVPQASDSDPRDDLPPGVGGDACADSRLFQIWRTTFLRAGKSRPICPEAAF